MSNTINADNGVVSGVAGLKYSADTSGQLILQTNTTNALTLDTNQNATFATGILATNPFTGTYTDGTVVDYITGVGRINVGPSDDIAFYHNGIGSRTEIARFTYTGRLGVGTASPGATLTVAGPQFDNKNTANIFSYDTAAIAADIGGGLMMGGYYTGTTPTAWAAISGLKNNATSGDYGGYLVLKTRTNGQLLAEAMRITSAGLVGIGTSTPGATLDVTRATTGQAFQIIKSNAGTGGANIYMQSDSGSTGTAVQFNWGAEAYTSGVTGGGTANAYPMTFFTNSAERMRIDSSGNVAIGSTNPYSKLDIVGSSTGAVQTFIKNSNGATGSSADLVFGVWSGAIPTGTGNPGPSAKISAINGLSSDARTDLAFSTYASGSSAERMRITYDGNVGIGTSSPSGFGSGASGPFLNLMSSGTSTSNTGEFYLGSAGTASGSSFGTLGFVTSGTASSDKRAALIYCTATASSASAPVAKLSFYTNNGSGLAERMIISSAGYVTNPYNPSFLAGAATSSYTVNNPVIFTATVYDTTSSYNTSNGRFTAPVSGTYFFGSVVLVSGSTSGAQYDFRLATSAGNFYYGSPGRISYSNPGTSWGDGYISVGCYMTLKLNAGDYVYITFSTFGAGAIYADGQADWCKFYGALIG
jgi:hypothetical protein